MKKLIIACILLSFLIGCSQAVNEVKNGKIIVMGQYVPVSQLIDGLAQADGKVAWSSFKSEKENNKITVVQADIERNGKKAIIQFLYNSERDVHQLAYCEVDGKPVSLLELSLKTMMGI